MDKEIEKLRDVFDQKGKAWNFIQDILQRLTTVQLPSDKNQVRNQLMKDGRIGLDVDWDGIVAGQNAIPTDTYLKRVYARASGLRAFPD